VSAASGWRLRSTAHLIIFGASLLVGLSPHGFAPIGSGLDDSWIAGLHHASATGARFGVDLIFTYGPWGFASEPLAYGSTMPWVVAYQGVLRFAVAGALVGLIASGGGCRRYLAAAIVAFLLLGPEPAIVACWLWVLNEAKQERSGSAWAAAAAGLLATGKGTQLWLGLLFALWTAAIDVRQRRFPLGGGMFVAAWVTAWLVAGQRLGAVAPYLISAIEILRGYTAAMSVWTPYDWCALPCLIAAICVGAAVKPRLGWFACLAAVVIGIAVVKIEYVRSGPDRAAKALASMLFMALSAAAANRTVMNRPLIVALGIIVGTGCLLPLDNRWDGLFVHHLRRLDPTLGEWRLGFQLRETREHFAAAMTRPEFTIAMPPGATVDVAPHFQGVAVAAGWSYKPRPVFQSYQAYTRRLAELNAEFFASPYAPDQVLATVAPIDNRFAPTDDGPCWREWIRRYRVAEPAGLFVRLVKSDQTRRLQTKSIGEAQRRFGERWAPPAIDPQRGFLWAEIDVAETALNRAASLAYKTVRPTISVDGHEGKELVPELGRAGFVLSPAIDSMEGLRRFIAREPAFAVQSVVVEASPVFYGSTYRVRLYEIDVD